MANYTYVLYLTIDQGQHDYEIIFLGSSAEPDLYYKALTIQYEVNPKDISIKSENRKMILVWKELVKAELPDAEEKKLDNAFMKGDNYCFTIGEMTLHLNKVQIFDKC